MPGIRETGFKNQTQQGATIRPPEIGQSLLGQISGESGGKYIPNGAAAIADGQVLYRADGNGIQPSNSPALVLAVDAGVSFITSFGDKKTTVASSNNGREPKKTGTDNGNTKSGANDDSWDDIETDWDEA